LALGSKFGVAVGDQQEAKSSELLTNTYI
jgi:hypothetical protein